MVFGWFIAAPPKENSHEKTLQLIENQILQQRKHGTFFKFQVPRDFKIASLDNFMQLTEVLIKVDINLESILKKLERQFVELDELEKPSILLEDREFKESIVKSPEDYIKTFTWKNKSFPLNRSLNDILNLMRIQQLEEDIRDKTIKYQELKNQFSAILKQESGNFLTKQLSDVLTPEVCPESDFINTEHLQTLVAVFHESLIQAWLKDYEFLDDDVVPRSTKQFNQKDADGNVIWRIVVFKRTADVIIQKARQKKYVLKEFTYKNQSSSQAKANKEQLEKEMKTAKSILVGTCKAHFSELYVYLCHIKAMRLYVESVLRYGVPANFVSFFMRPQVGKEKKLLKDMTLLFLKPGESAELYGTKEETEDSEDFFPFIFAPIGVPSS